MAAPGSRDRGGGRGPQPPLPGARPAPSRPGPPWREGRCGTGRHGDGGGPLPWRSRRGTARVRAGGRQSPGARGRHNLCRRWHPGLFIEAGALCCQSLGLWAKGNACCGGLSVAARKAGCLKKGVVDSLIPPCHKPCEA